MSWPTWVGYGLSFGHLRRRRILNMGLEIHIEPSVEDEKYGNWSPLGFTIQKPTIWFPFPIRQIGTRVGYWELGNLLGNHSTWHVDVGQHSFSILRHKQTFFFSFENQAYANLKIKGCNWLRYKHTLLSPLIIQYLLTGGWVLWEGKIVEIRVFHQF